MSLNTPEPAPIPNAGQSVWPLVIADIRRKLPLALPKSYQNVLELLAADCIERGTVGTAKHKTPLCVGDGRRGLIDAYQESLDLVVYLKKSYEEETSDDRKKRLRVQYYRSLRLAADLRTLLID